MLELLGKKRLKTNEWRKIAAQEGMSPSTFYRLKRILKDNGPRCWVSLSSSADEYHPSSDVHRWRAPSVARAVQASGQLRFSAAFTALEPSICSGHDAPAFNNASTVAT